MSGTGYLLEGHLKIIILAVLALLLVPNISHAQLIRAYGFHAGYSQTKEMRTYSVPSSILSFDTGKISGFTAGGFVEFLPDPHLRLVCGVEYLAKGSVISVPTVVVDSTNPNGYRDAGIVEVRRRLDYLHVPVMLKLRSDFYGFTQFISAGPGIDFLVSRPVDGFYQEFRSVNLSVSAAAGAEFPVKGGPTPFIELKFCNSITDVFHNEFQHVNYRTFKIDVGVMWR